MTTESRRTPDEDILGTVIGHYKVTAVLNQGGMGAVYRAEHPLIGKPAVIKLLLPDLSSHEEMVRRFFNEAKAASAIRHPGIVEIFDFGYHTDGRAYIVMEFLDGQSLGDRLAERGRLTELEAAVLTRSIAGALGAAHAKGIVHRDLKPDNVFLVPDPDMPTGERAKVLDFGIAKLSESAPAEVSRTRTGTLMGTPLYMAPEQARGAGEVDARADLYSLGCMLYEMLTGQPPFVADGSGEIIAMQLFAEPIAPREIVPELSPRIEAIVLGLLAKDPAKRTPTAKALADSLGAAQPQLSARLSAALPAPTTRPRPVVSTPRPGAPPSPTKARTVEAALPSLPPGASRSQLADAATELAAEPARPSRPTAAPTTLGGSAAHVIPALDDAAPPRGRGRAIAIAGGVVLAGAIAAFVIVRSMRHGDGGGRAAGASGAGDPGARSSAAGPRGATTPTPTPPIASPAAPTTMALTLHVDPPGATFTLDGAAIAPVGDALTLPRDGAHHALVASAPGFAPRTIDVQASGDQTLELALAPTAPAPTTTTAPPTTTTTAPPTTATTAPPTTTTATTTAHPTPHVHGHTTPAHTSPTAPANPPVLAPVKPGDVPKGPATSPNGSPIETNL